MRRGAVGPIAPLLVASGASALALQIAWMREFRLVFGYSTAASAAVLAIFMGGLGAGGFFWGRRVDRAPSPLRLYGRLEVGVALSAALSPLLLDLVTGAYISAGGSASLGPVLAAVIRLLLATLVLAVPTFLMGGTLPAAVRAATSDEDRGRTGLSLLYGANTLGAVAGATVATFVLIEALGNRLSIWSASAALGLIGGAALLLSKRLADAREESPRTASAKTTKNTKTTTKKHLRSGDAPAEAPVPFIFAAAAIVGFAFFLMEIVWYRMLTPLLGGSVYTFGIILAVALLGIGAGGIAYRIRPPRRSPTLTGFAASCGLEAACLALPFALGDRIAIYAISLYRGEATGLASFAWDWTLVTAIVVLPAALVAGYQFPLLVGLLGRGREAIGRHVGHAYGWNTGGAIAGSLAGGFGFLPLLTAPGTWKATIVLLAVLGLLALALALSRGERRPKILVVPLAAAIAALVMANAAGPTAAWRHSAIGARRATVDTGSATAVRDWLQGVRRTIVWESDGVESAVGIQVGSTDGISVVVNGKSDGSSIGDIGTMMIPGLIAGVRHEEPRRALVVGLGTGITAGWIAAMPTIERVDVVELEPDVVEAAEACADANRDVLRDPKVRLIFGDAREFLLTTDETYDLIVSQPSNPYRAGVASLFTREFYLSSAERLREGGIFAQWVQAYEIRRPAIESVYATLATAFPTVETWQTQAFDMLFLAGEEAIPFDVPRIAERMQSEPFRSAFHHARRVEGVEGLLAHYVAGPAFAKRLAERGRGSINTDDRMFLEFAFARSAGGQTMDHVTAFREESAAAGDPRVIPAGAGIEDWRVESQRDSTYLVEGRRPPLPSDATRERRMRVEAKLLSLTGDHAQAVPAWSALAEPPSDPLEVVLLAETLARAGREGAIPWIERAAATDGAEAAFALAALRMREGRTADAGRALEEGITRLGSEPWALADIVMRGFDLVPEVARRDRAAGERLLEKLLEPFSLNVLQVRRTNQAINLAVMLGLAEHCVPAYAALEPHVPWQEGFLAARLRCYEAAGDPRRRLAARDLDQFRAGH